MNAWESGRDDAWFEFAEAIRKHPIVVRGVDLQIGQLPGLQSSDLAVEVKGGRALTGRHREDLPRVDCGWPVEEAGKGRRQAHLVEDRQAIVTGGTV